MSDHLENLTVKIDYKKLIHHEAEMKRIIALGKVTGDKIYFHNLEEELRRLTNCIDTTENEVTQEV